MKAAPKKPTAMELEILGVLWKRGPATVREVHETMRPGRDVGYTTVLKLLQIMTEKGIVRRDESQRAHIYRADRPAEQTKRQLAADILQRVFEGSTSQLMMHALAGRNTSAQELEELRRILDSHNGPGDGKSD